MKRRSIIKLSGLGLGLTLTGGAFVSLLSSCKQDVANGVASKVLGKNTLLFLDELAEIILPKTDTPGAKDVQVAAFIDHFISKAYDSKSQTDFKINLNQLQEACETKFDKDLTACTKQEKIAFVTGLESKGYNPSVSIWGNTVNDGDQLPFYKQLKSTIMWAYFGSEDVGKNVLLYQQLAPNYIGCVDVTDETRLPSI